MNNGNCSVGIGVSINGGERDGDPGGFTLLDQFEVARTPQISQVIGGLGYTDEADYPSSGGIEGNGSAHAEFIVGVTSPTNAAKEAADPSIDGSVIVQGTANMTTLLAGWVAV
jgi:hypothetical protein